jgi:repressor LexA
MDEPSRPPVFGVGPRVAILACLSDSLARRGYGPTVREIATAVGLGHPTVYRHLAWLRKAGYVTWEDGKARTLRFRP